MRLRILPSVGVALALLLTVANVAVAQPAGTPPSAASDAPVQADGPAMASPRPPDVIPADCVNPPPKKKTVEKPLWERLIPIALLVGLIAFVVGRLPKVDLGHTVAFRRRRMLNWLPLGLTYSFLYMARYNLTEFKESGGITNAEFGDIFFWGSMTYGLAFFINGPLTDRWGGRVTILLAASGAMVSNLLIGYMLLTGNDFGDRLGSLTVFYCVNMYFQSFGAVSIVKVNASWFHLRERGTFGGIFGILISLGLFFAFDGGKLISETFPGDRHWLFFIPAMLLVVFFVLCWLFVRDNPSDAGHADFDPGDASSGTDNERVPALRVMRKIFTNPIIMTVAVIELCSGFLRQAIIQWGKSFGKGLNLQDTFVIENWGLVQCMAGIIGGMFAGAISDHLFNSRRLPVSAVLYTIMLAGAVAIVPLFGTPGAIMWVVAFMSMSIIGVHGMLSGTASADFGGRKNAGIAVGIIDGFVYFGSMVQSKLYGQSLPAEKFLCPDGKTWIKNPAASDPDNWSIWPYAMIPVATVGLVLAIILWNARPGGKPKPPTTQT